MVINKQDNLAYEQQIISELAVDQLFDVVKSHSPVISNVIAKFGDRRVSTYLESVARITKVYYQDRTDFIEIVSRFVSATLGDSIAKQVSRDLIEEPVVITANHHGVDSFAQSVQGTLLTFLRSLVNKVNCKTLTVLSFGNVPINNITFPRGLLIYRVPQQHIENIPVRLPIFPDRDKRKMVSVVRSYDGEMIYKTQMTVRKLIKENKIDKTLEETINAVLEKGFTQQKVIEQLSYSQQVTLLNEFLWKKMFTENTNIPALIYLEIEKITIELLELDLTNNNSLAWHVLFNSTLRNEIIDELDGCRACWSKLKLKRRLEMEQGEDREQNGSTGTLFFWGVDNRGGRIPLTIETNRGSDPILQGIDDNNRYWSVPFREKPIAEALQAGQLIPSLFTCFVVLCFARGLTCLGGYFQAQYLPRMQMGLVKALSNQGRYRVMAQLLAAVPTDAYLSGMQTVMCELDNKYLVPAGPIEMIAGGGLGNTDIEKILSLTVREAHLASLIETAADLIPKQFLLNGWKTRLASKCKDLLGDRLVIK
jgi:hypothetical protein